MNIRIGASTSEAYAYQEMISELQRELADYKSQNVPEAFFKDVTREEIREFARWRTKKQEGHNAKRAFQSKTNEFLATCRQAHIDPSKPKPFKRGDMGGCVPVPSGAGRLF